MAEYDQGYKEFLCHLLIYVSHVDMEFSSEEKERIGSLFDNETYEKVYNAFLKMSDYQALQYILDRKEAYYNSEEQKATLMDNVKIQLFSDGEYSPMEQEVFRFLDRML